MEAKASNNHFTIYITHGRDYGPTLNKYMVYQTQYGNGIKHFTKINTKMVEVLYILWTSHITMMWIKQKVTIFI
jgi:hypothetical protein